VEPKAYLNAFTKVKDELIHKPRPARVAIGVAELITSGALIEIRAIARRRWTPGWTLMDAEFSQVSRASDPRSAGRGISLTM